MRSPSIRQWMTAPIKANQNYDIGLRVLTPWYEGGTDDGTLRLLSGQGKEVLVVLPNDVRS